MGRLIPVLLANLFFLISTLTFAGIPNELANTFVEFKIEKNHDEGTHSILLDVTGKHGTVILTTEEGKILSYKTFLSSTDEVVFNDLNSGTYLLCVKHDRHTFVETITIP